MCVCSHCEIKHQLEQARYENSCLTIELNKLKEQKVMDEVLDRAIMKTLQIATERCDLAEKRTHGWFGNPERKDL